jgi:hypothetical protein
MKNYNEVHTFNEFWPLYLKAHSSRASRALHFGGLVLSAGAAVWMLAHGLIFFIALSAVPAVIGAGLGHRMSPRTSKTSEAPESHIVDEAPLWAALADLKMFGLALTGRLGRELASTDRPSLPSKPAWSL